MQTLRGCTIGTVHMLLLLSNMLWLDGLLLSTVSQIIKLSGIILHSEVVVKYSFDLRSLCRLAKLQTDGTTGSGL